MMKHLQCRLSPTPKNEKLLKKYIDTNTELVLRHNTRLRVGRKLFI